MKLYIFNNYFKCTKPKRRERKVGSGLCHKYILCREVLHKTQYDNCILVPVYLSIRRQPVVNYDLAFVKPIYENDSWAFVATSANQGASLV